MTYRHAKLSWFSKQFGSSLWKKASATVGCFSNAKQQQSSAKPISTLKNVRSSASIQLISFVLLAQIRCPCRSQACLGKLLQSYTDNLDYLKKQIGAEEIGKLVLQVSAAQATPAPVSNGTFESSLARVLTTNDQVWFTDLNIDFETLKLAYQNISNSLSPLIQEQIFMASQMVGKTIQLSDDIDDNSITYVKSMKYDGKEVLLELEQFEDTFFLPFSSEFSVVTI
ncbi:hypothetical protein HK096_005309 [Nowakowskiella sp. JEL0078]|nr:hypothetical protein HK096_005309 [Nowakowskiella sp. JEL0078]